MAGQGDCSPKHHYWTGPVDDLEQRQLVLRYLAPISVGSELPVTTVVRPAR
jgi:hypothetical protein